MRIPWSEWGPSTRSGRGSSPGGRRKWRLLLVPAMGIAVICQLSLTGTAGAATAAATAKTASLGRRRAATRRTSSTATAGARSTARSGRWPGPPARTRSRSSTGSATRFEDNGQYIGHDEPSVKFISSTPGSGNTMTYLTKIPVDPQQSPTPSGSVTNYGAALRRALVRPADLRPEVLPAEPVHPGQRHQHRLNATRTRRARRSWSCSCTRRATPRSSTADELQRDQVVRGAEHRQPGVHVRLRHLQQQLHRAGQLLLPADQRRPGRAAEPAADQREHVHPERATR